MLSTSQVLVFSVYQVDLFSNCRFIERMDAIGKTSYTTIKMKCIIIINSYIITILFLWLFN